MKLISVHESFMSSKKSYEKMFPASQWSEDNGNSSLCQNALL